MPVLREWRAEIRRHAIRAFAGEDVDVARYYPADDAFLLTRPTGVRHYDVREFGLR